MKVKELIEQLKKYNNLDDEIVCAYSAYDDVCDSYDDFNKSDWHKLVSRFDNYEFPQFCDEIDNEIRDILEHKL